MKIVFKNPISFKNLIQLLSSVNSVAWLYPTKNGIILKSIDPATVILVFAELPKSSMVVYDMEEAKQGDYYAIPVDKLKRFLSKIKADTELSLTITDNNRVVLSTLKPFRSKIGLPLYVEDPLEISPTDIPFQAGAEVYGAVLLEAMDIAKNISNEVKFIMEADKVVIHAENDTTDADIELTDEHDWVNEIWIDEDAEPPVKGIYGLTYLRPVVRAVGRSTVVNLMWGNDLPLYVGYNDPDGFEVAVYLAPRVED